MICRMAMILMVCAFAFGGEEVTDGLFPDLGNWVGEGGEGGAGQWTAAGGEATIDGAQAGTVDLTQTINGLVDQQWYRISYTMTRRAAGELVCYFDGVILGTDDSVATFNFFAPADGASADLVFQADADFDGDIDIASVVAMGEDSRNCFIGGTSSALDHAGVSYPGASIALGVNGEQVWAGTSTDVDSGDGGQVLITTNVDIANDLTGVFVNIHTNAGSEAVGRYQILYHDQAPDEADTLLIELDWIDADAANMQYIIGGAVPYEGGDAGEDWAAQEIFDHSLNSAAGVTITTWICEDGVNTWSADIAKDAGGGGNSTQWRLWGCDSSWARIVPTRTSVGAGKANFIHDTTGMVTVTLAANAEFRIAVDTVHLDGLHFDGDTAHAGWYAMVGGNNVDDSVFSNCVFDNAETTASTYCVVLNNYNVVYNCDFISSGVTANTLFTLDADTYLTVMYSTFTTVSTSASSRTCYSNHGTVSNSLFYDIDGIAVQFGTAGGILHVNNCTFENVGTCIAKADADWSYIMAATDNIAVNCTTFWNNPNAANDILFQERNVLDTVTNHYLNTTSTSGYLDLTGDPLFVNEGGGDYNLQAGSPAKNTGPLLGNRGAMSDVDAGGGVAGHGNKSGGKQ